MKNSLLQSIKRQVRKRFKPSPYGWFGNFQSWNQALQETTGYDQQAILEKVKEATLKVKCGEAVYERDSVLFEEIQYSKPLLETLQEIAEKNNGVKVIDFGGSLGSSYFQNREILDRFPSSRWNVVEQENFVACGKECIASGQLCFFESVDECIRQNGLPDLLLLSCTLPYIKEPYDLLTFLAGKNIRFFMIDNTPFNFLNADRLTIQKVPPAIYTASYPCWFLDYEKVKGTLEKQYKVRKEFTNDSVIELDYRPLQYKGCLFELKL